MTEHFSKQTAIYIALILTFSYVGFTRENEKQDHHEREGHGHEGEELIGESKAIMAVNPDQGMRLSPKAIRALGLTLSLVKNVSVLRIPPSGLVYSQEAVGVYRIREDWYKRVPVAVASKSSQWVVIRSTHIRAGDQIVVAGVHLVRVAEMSLHDLPEGHGH